MLTTTEAAEVAAVAPSTIKRWADHGILPFSRTAGGPAFPGPDPSDSFYGKPPVAEPSVDIVNASC
jgi:excisionase family DNA binding protein